MAQTSRKRRPPALTQEARENQLIAMAYDLAERRLMEGTASAQEVTHFLKLGSTTERLEKARLQEQIKMLEAKTEALQSAKHVEELYSNALKAMKSYTSDREDE